MEKDYNSFDVTIAMDRTGGGVERFLEMAEFFPSYVIDLLSPIELAWAKRDITALQKSAHKLKGSLGMVGAGAAFQLAESLELEAATWSESSVEKQIADLKVEIKSLTLELQQFVKDHHAT